jgi:hypothetical protein
MEARALPLPDPESFRLALRVRHPSMDPDILSLSFGTKPVHSFRAGDPCASRSVGLSDAPVHQESYWLGELNAIGRPLVQGLFGVQNITEQEVAALRKDLSGALAWGCTLFFSTRKELLRRIRSEGGEVALLVTIYSVDSFSLAPAVSKVLGELGITIEFELANE